MIKIGRNVRAFNHYKKEVEFSRKHNFDLMQVWYDKNGIGLYKDNEPKKELIKEFDFPTIIHAVLDINDFKEHIPKVKEIAKYLGHKEVIIHPLCESEEVNSDTIYKLSKKINFALNELQKEDIKLYLENNSKKSPIFTSIEEIKIMFNENPKLEFLLDIAHIDDYDHLKEMVSIKEPKILHIADRHFDIIHEHLPLGEGEIDYTYIFREILNKFEGKIILEIDQNDDAIIRSRDMIKKIVTNK